MRNRREPYSIGMLLLEALKEDAGRLNIKIFGTDICRDIVGEGKAGRLSLLVY